MPDYAGSLQRLVLSRTLWLIVVWPAAGAMWQLLVERRRPAYAARRTAVISLALALTATIAHVVLLARLSPGRRALFQALGSNSRIGQLDVSVALWFDSLAASASVLACVLALGAALLVPQRLAGVRGWRVWAWIHLTLGASLVAFLADGFVTTAIGWSLAAVCAAWLAAWTDPRAARIAATRGAVAVAALVVGAVAIFWGLGGTWDGDEFAPDVQPAFVAARMGSDPAPRGVPARPPGSDEAAERAPGGTLTMTGSPGAQVFVDEARKESLRAPFVGVPVQGGSHSFRIRRGAATEESVVPRVTFEGGDEIALVPLGPTLAFRSIADQLSLRDRRGDAFVRRAFEARVLPGGMPLVAAAFLAWLVAAVAMSAPPPPAGSPRVLTAVVCGAGPALLGPYFLVRVANLTPLAPHATTALFAVGAVALLAAARVAARVPGVGPQFLAVLAAAPVAVPCAALGIGGTGAYLEAMMASGLAAAGLHLLASRRAAWGGGDGTSPAKPKRGRHGVHERRREGPPGELLFVVVPERLGLWFASMERWVVEAVAGALAGLARAGAWTVATADAHGLSKPADAVAVRMTRAAHRLAPIVGGSMARIVWTLLGVAGFAALVHALWPVG